MKLKKILLSTLASSVLLSSGLMANDNIDILKEKLVNVQQELELLKGNIGANSEINDALFNAIVTNNDDLFGIDERVTTLEDKFVSLVETVNLKKDNSKTALDKVKWGFDIREQVDSGTTNYTDGSSSSRDTLFSSRVRFNFETQVTDNMVFEGRAAMYKYWGNSSNNSLSDFNEGRSPNTSSIYLERAEIEWSTNIGNTPVRFLIGRLPTGDGNSKKFKNNDMKESITSVLAFDGASDGIISQIHMTKNQKLSLMYTKMTQNGGAYTDNVNADESQIFGVLYDLNLDNISKGMLLSMGAGKAVDIQHPTISNVTAGDLDLIYTYLEVPKLYKGLSLFVHGAMSKTHPNSSIPVAQTLFGTSDSKTGYAVWAGVRYKFNLPNLNNPRIGFEYNHGTQYWANFSGGASETINKLSVRGDAFDFYYTQPINDFSFIRFGYTYVQKDYTNSATDWFSPVNDINSALSVDTEDSHLFNITFNLKF